jgi:tubulin epsilon
MGRNVAKIKDKLRMIYWNTEGFKVALCGVPPLGHNQSLLMLSNNCAIACRLRELQEKFMKLYSVRSHVHHYTEYLELPYFDKTMEIIGNVVEDYDYLNLAQPPERPPQSLRDLLV